MKAVLVSVIVFVAILLVQIFTFNDYSLKSERNYTHTISKEIEILIQSQLDMTFEIAKNFALSKKVIDILQKDNYAEFYKKNFFKIDYDDKENIFIHIVDKNGKQAYLSWTKKTLGENILKIRKDLQKIYKSHQPLKSISVGRFDVSFKGIMPIYSEKGDFLGVIEVITHFDTIAKRLLSDKIYSLIIVDKRFKQQLRYAPKEHFTKDGYFISLNTLPPKVHNVLSKVPLKELMRQNSGFYLCGSFFHEKEGFFVVDVPIKDVDKKQIAHYIAFAKDKYALARHKMIIFVGYAALVALFVFLLFLIVKRYISYKKLVETLNSRVRQEVEKNLHQLAIDPLTGSFRKLRFDTDKHKHIGEYLVMFNIRNFSKINEEYSFDVGDEVLKITAKRIEHILGRKIYRIDADEFVFFSNNFKEEIAKIKSSFIDTPISIPGSNIRMRLSFSFSVIRNDARDILRRLSIALKGAKREPFKDYVEYKEHEKETNFLEFNSLLYDALFFQKNAKIVPFFQAFIDNKTKEPIKYEALARLQTKTDVYTPFHFLEIAKSSGFIYEITKIMIEKSFEQAGAYKKEHAKELALSINITEDDLLTNDLKPFLSSMFEKYDIDPKSLTLEILEGITSSGTKNSIEQLRELKTLGLKLAIDDFGVEYSNFERLSELEIDFIKIDGKYIQSIHKNQKSYFIVKAIVEFAKTMHIQTIAEFVSSKEIYETVCELGIDYSQGYYFHKPSKQIPL